MTDSKSSGVLLHERNERLKIWAGLAALLITNAVALGTSITAHMKADDETKAKTAYKELSTAVAEVSKDNIQLHSDLSNLRGYLAGLAQNGAFTIPKPEPVGSGAGFGLGAGSVAHPALRPIARNGSIHAAPTESSAPAAKVAEAPPPPKMSAKPEQYQPKSVDSL